MSCSVQFTIRNNLVPILLLLTKYGILIPSVVLIVYLTQHVAVHSPKYSLLNVKIVRWVCKTSSCIAIGLAIQWVWVNVFQIQSEKIHSRASPQTRRWKLGSKPGCAVPLIEKVVELLGLRKLFKRKKQLPRVCGLVDEIAAAGHRARPLRDKINRHNEVTDDHRDEVDQYHRHVVDHHYVALRDSNCPCEIIPFQT